MAIPSLAFVGVFTITPVGGVVLGGSAPVDVSPFAPVGGVRLAGGAPEVWTGLGGPALGGSATVSVLLVNVYNFDELEPRGTSEHGARVGGEALVQEYIIFKPTAGAIVGGAATVSDRIPYTPTGGMLTGGTAAMFDVFVPVPAGGVALAGVAPALFVTVPVPVGGAVVGGGATITDRQAFYQPTGGVVLAGAATAYAQLYGGPVATTENPTNNAFPSWVINLDTYAPSRYVEFIANSFARFNGTTYIANAGGIYAVDADNDQGRAISAHFTMAKTDFNMSYEKKVPVVYMGAKLKGQNPRMKVRVTVNKLSPVYYEFNDSRAKSDTVRGLRTTTGKGLLGRYWRFRFDNLNGTDFEFDTVELNPVQLTRRGA